MKRRLSLLLAVVMILGSFSFAFADEGVDVPAFLNKNGILVGNDDGDLMLDEYLLRKDAVVLLARLLDKEEEAKAFNMEGYPTYDDLKGNPYYDAFLGWAEYNEYFVGVSETSFGYEDNLEAVQYAIVLLRALGYGNDDRKAEWEEAWDLAEELGLLKDVKVERRDEILRSDVAQMTYNALGVKMKDSDKTLAEFLGIEMPVEPKPEKLEVVEVYTENLAEVVVELSNAELVKNKDALLNPANYRLNNDAKVYHVDLDGDNVILTLVPYGEVEKLETPTVLTKGKKFNLTIRNIDPAINSTYKNVVANDNAIPVVENVEFMGTHGIKVTTSEPIANPLERNFRLDSRTSMIVEQYGRDIILTPYHGKAFDKEAVELTVDILEDFAGYKSVKEVYEMEISDDDALPVVEEAYRSGSKLVVVFDRDVYHDSISAYVNRRVLGNASFVERRVTFYAQEAKKVDTNVVEYIFGREIPAGIEVVIEGVANHFDKAMEKQSIVPVEFKDEYAPVIINFTNKVEVTDAFLDAERGTEVNTEEMTITFDKDIAEFVVVRKEGETAEQAKERVIDKLNGDIEDFFTLYELDITKRGENAAKDVVIKVADIGDDYIELTFEGIKLNNKDRDYDYVLEVRNFSDLSRNRMDRDYLDFQVVLPSAAFKVELKEINNTRYFNRDGVEIVLEFNDYVDKEEASNAKNYYLDGKLAVSEAIVERDGYTVSLVVYDTTVSKLLEKYDVLEISPRVTNADGDSLSQTNRFVELMNNDDIAAKKAAQKVIDLIKALPEVKDITAENLEEVREKAKEAREAYKALTEEQQKLVTNLPTLEEVEAKIDALDEEAAEEQELESAKEELSKAIEEAEKVLEEAKEILGEDSEEVMDLQNAINAAKVALVDAEDIGVDKVNDAKNELKSAMEAVKDLLEEKEEPAPGEEITATVEFVTEVLGVRSYDLTLENAKVEDVTRVLVDGKNVDFEIVDETIQFNVTSGEPSKIEVEINGKLIKATIK